MKYLIVLSVPGRRLSSNRFAIESAFGDHLRTLKSLLAPLFAEFVIAGVEMSEANYQRDKAQLTEIDEAREGISLVTLYPQDVGRVGFWLGQFLSVLLRLSALVRDADLVHSTTSDDLGRPVEFPALMLAAYYAKKSISITNKDRRRDAFMNYRMGRMSRLRYLFHQLVYDPIRFAQYPLVARFCSLVLFKGAELTRDFGKGRPSVRSIRDPGFSAEHIIEAAALESKLVTLRDPAQPLELLYFGRLVYYKGVDRCVRALARLAERGVEDVRLNIMGTGIEMEPLRELVSELGLCDRVEFLEPAPYGPEFFGRLQPCHLMLAAPLSEDTPRSTWDAIASGLPVLAFDTLFYRSMADTGVVETVEWPSIDALAARIEHYCAQREELAALVARAPEVARENTQEIWLDKRVRWTRELFEAAAPSNADGAEEAREAADRARRAGRAPADAERNSL